MSFEDIVYELKARNKENGKSRIKGVTSEDFVYLLMPDRFSVMVIQRMMLSMICVTRKQIAMINMQDMAAILKELKIILII